MSGVQGSCRFRFSLRNHLTPPTVMLSLPILKLALTTFRTTSLRSMRGILLDSTLAIKSYSSKKMLTLELF